MAKAKACCAATKKSGATKKRVVFKLNTEAGKIVSVAGSFNDWDDKAKYLVDKNNTGEYVGILMLAPGVYEYKFVIDGVWHLDENNSNFSPNDFGTLNSVIEVK
ncbi:MAG: glycogen-binding domain-containing protein [Lentisphaeria bacterium]|nr:glycogen-binding domain-containing protein [Lentisphaeria bacterium]